VQSFLQKRLHECATALPAVSETWPKKSQCSQKRAEKRAVVNKERDARTQMSILRSAECSYYLCAASVRARKRLC